MTNDQYIEILSDSLEKKITVLHKIQETNKKQRLILTSEQATPDDLEDSLEEKDYLIDELNSLDDGFEETFKHVEAELKQNKEKHRDEIKKMQDLIRQITDLSVELQREEQENKELADKKFANIREKAKRVRASKKAVNNYYRSAGKVDYDTPQFFDNKK